MIQLDIRSLHLTEQQFFQLCQDNRELRLERTAQGAMIMMTPAGGGSGKRNSSLNAQLWLWNKQHKLGVVFDSSTGFILPNSAVRSPDAAWIPQARWDALNEDQQERFLPLCPDFVVELRSRTDSLKMTREKMHEYMQNGARLGWLIDPQTHQVEVYRQGDDASEVLHHPATLTGENVLPSFVLDLAEVWE